MEKINEFLKKNTFIIIVVFILFTFFRSCSDRTELMKIRKQIDNSYTKPELDYIIKIEGLKVEKRLIQATDRKLLDVKKINDLGWKAETNLTEGIKTTYEWFINHYYTLRKK